MTDKMITERINIPTISRRTFGKLAIGTGGAVVAEYLGSKFGLETEGVFIPDYVHAIEGAEEDIENGNGEIIGRLFTQTGDKMSQGFSVVDDGTGQFWTAFNRLGGVQKLGYPISQPFTQEDGYTIQIFQGAVLQVNGLEAENQNDNVVIFNGCDREGLYGQELANPELRKLLDSEGVPSHLEGSFDPPERLQWLEPDSYADPKDRQAATAFKEEYYKRGGPAILGYPTSLVDNRGLFAGLRLQRGILQYWQEKLPDHPELPAPGVITSFLIGDMLKRSGFVSQKNEVFLQPGRYATGGNPDIITPSNFPERLGNIETDWWSLENNGKKVGLNIRDPQRLTEIFHEFENDPRKLELKVYDPPTEPLPTIAAGTPLGDGRTMGFDAFYIMDGNQKIPLIKGRFSTTSISSDLPADLKFAYIGQVNFPPYFEPYNNEKDAFNNPFNNPLTPARLYIVISEDVLPFIDKVEALEQEISYQVTSEISGRLLGGVQSDIRRRSTPPYTSVSGPTPMFQFKINQ